MSKKGLNQIFMTLFFLNNSHGRHVSWLLEVCRSNIIVVETSLVACVG